MPYIQDITGKSINDISEKELHDYTIDMIYICTDGKHSKELLNEFCQLTQQEVKQKLAENAFIRETLNKKFGIVKDYKFEGNIGDNGICDSLDFNINDILYLASKHMTDKQFKLISSEYINEILTVIMRKANLNVYFVYNGKDYSNSQLIDNYNQFLSGAVELNMENKIVLKEMINLISTYSLDELLTKKVEVKKEISSGIYDYIKMPNPKISQYNRKKLNKINDIWNRNDIANYNNLPLLMKRYRYILENGKLKNEPDIANILEQVKDAINNGIPDKDVDYGYNAYELSAKMNEWYKYFKKINKEDILDSVYSPPKNNNEITKKEEVPQSMLVHFYNANSGLKKIFQLVAINRARKEHGEKPIVLKSLIGMYKDKELQKQIDENLLRFKDYIKTTNIDSALNELQPNLSFNLSDSDEGIPRLDVLMTAQKQLACYLINKDSLINLLDYDSRMSSGKGNVAFGVGFSKEGVKPEKILLSCDSNANSNIGVENIPCEDSFVELSKTYKELSEVNNKRTEILLDRNGIKPNYLLILKGKNINKYDVELIQAELKKAKNLEMPSIVVDIGAITRSEEEKNICYEK